MTTPPIPPYRAQSVTAHVCREHRLLDDLLREVCDDVDQGRFLEARATAEAFAGRLCRHIRMEEALLFPLFEARVGLVGGPTAVLRQEHREIERCVGLMREALEHGDADAFQEALQLLRATQLPHNSREEHVLAPTTDAALSESERKAAEERLRRATRGPAA